MAAEMFTDFPWLRAATVAGAPTFDEMALLRELAEYDADVDPDLEPDPWCDTCRNRGFVVESAATYDTRVSCPDCDRDAA